MFHRYETTTRGGIFWMNSLKLIYACLMLSIVSGSAFAKDRGTFNYENEIYKEHLSFGTGSTVQQVTVSYKVWVQYHAHEEGKASVIDNRRCYFDGQARKIIRTMTALKKNGETVELASKEYTLSNPKSKAFEGFPNDNCNKHMSDTDDLKPLALGEIGNADTWKQYIKADSSEFMKVIDMFGEIEKRWND